MALLTAVLTVLGILFAQPLVTLFADGYDPQTAELAASLTRVMFPTVLFTGVAFSFVGILQAMDRFNIPALISTVSNLVIIGYFFSWTSGLGCTGWLEPICWAGCSRRWSRRLRCASWTSGTGRTSPSVQRGCGRPLP